MDSIKIKGQITISIVDAKTKEIKEIHYFENIITTLGLKMHRNWVAGVVPLSDSNFNVDTRITHIAVGSGNSTPAKTQLALDTELLRKAIYPTPDANCGITLESDDTAVFTMLISESEINGSTIKEIGLFSASHTAFMVSRFLCGSIAKSSAVQIVINYKVKYQ